MPVVPPWPSSPGSGVTLSESELYAAYRGQAVTASSDALGFQSREGGSQPTSPLQLFDLGVPQWTDRDEVRFVSVDTARQWFARYHYSGTEGAPNSWFYGVFRGDMVAVVAIGWAANKSGMAAKCGLEQWPGNLEVTRVAVHPDAPQNTASRVVARVLKRAAGERGLSWFFSYADTGQGHHGGIYQALGAVYVGLSSSEKGYRYNGEPTHPRAVIHRWGSRAADFVATIPGLEVVADLNTPKHTYILPVGPEAAAIREHLRQYAKPYPKRVAT